MSLCIYPKGRYDASTDILEETMGNAVTSTPPSSKFRVINVYVDPTTGNTIIEYDNTPVP